MTIISTNFGDFKIENTGQTSDGLKVVHPSSNKVLLVITDVHWRDKDAITHSIYKNKKRILKRLNEIK